MQPKFLYFDLGKVLVDFDAQQMCRQMGDVAGIDPGRVQQVVFDDGLLYDYETGRIGGPEFHEAFCRQTQTQPDYEALRRAANEIFELKVSMLPVVVQLAATGHRMGILSNTCESHWSYCKGRFSILDGLFPVHALSYEIGATKPDAAIFEKAAELAGAAPQEIFFVDDIPQHVAGARAVGFDAAQYTSTPQLVAELRSRDVGFNY